MWKPLLISALNHPYLLCPGDRPSQANYCTQHSRGSRLGRKRAVEEAFPTVLRCILLHEGSLSSMEEHHGNRGQAPTSHLLIQTSPRESTLLRKRSRLYRYRYLEQVHTGASNIGQHFAFSFFGLAFLEKRKCQGLCHVLFGWFINHLKTIQQTLE